MIFCSPNEMRPEDISFAHKENGKEQDELDKLSELETKEYVRRRDGYACRDCGMTREQHQEKYGKDLDVHRLIPGVNYYHAWCVTLCRACHGKKPKNAGDALWCRDLRWVYFNLYDADDARLYSFLQSRAVYEDTGPDVLLTRLLASYLAEWADRDRADVVAQADGLW